MTKSLKINGVLNIVRIFSTMAIPLITFPYISRVLQVENLGISNFVQSISSYFLLISALGVTSYAIREGSRLVKESSINDFASEVFSINMLSTIVAYGLLFITIFAFPRIFEYRVFLLIYSVTLFFNTIGVEWIFSVYEDYFYLTVRTIVFQVLSIVALFYFVRSTDDLMTYIIILTITKSIPSILNIIYARKYVKLKFKLKMNLKDHLKPILIIFATTIATTIYVNSDMTMLGLMDSTFSVGLYTASVKVYSIIKMLLSALIIVSLPRISSLLANKQEHEYQSTLSKVFNSLMLFALPMSVGLFFVSDGLIQLFAGSSYALAATSLQILSLTLVFSALGSFYATSVLLPLREERIILFASIISAVVNIVLNLIAIPLLSLNGAALTTLVSEIVMILIMFTVHKGKPQILGARKNLVSIVIGCLTMTSSILVMHQLFQDVILRTVSSVMIGGVVYFLVLLWLKNSMVIEIMHTMRQMTTKLIKKQ